MGDRVAPGHRIRNGFPLYQNAGHLAENVKVRFSNKDWFFFCSSLAVAGIGILQPINPIFGYFLIIIGVPGMISVLIIVFLRRPAVKGKDVLNELSLDK